MSRYIAFILLVLCFNLSIAQVLAPKKASAFTVKQVHSGHSLTDPLFYPHWPGQYVNLIAYQNSLQAWQLADVMVGKSTIPGSSIKWRWENPIGTGAVDARLDIANWELLCITERVPLLYEGGNNQQWYLDGIQEQKEFLSKYVNNAWTNGNNKKGAPTLLWTTWTNIDNSNGPWRQMLDIQGAEFERMQDYANANKPAAAPPVYMIPGHKMMARLYDDIQLGRVPGITNINQFFGDNIHTNELGAYAICMIHYACIFNKSPLGLPNNLIPDPPPNTPIPSKELATYLQTMIWDVVTHYSRTGITVTTDTNDEAIKNFDFVIYPNPSNEFIYLEVLDQNLLQKPSYSVCNSFGQIMYSGNEFKINISNWPNGAYVLKIADQYRKFIKN